MRSVLGAFLGICAYLAVWLLVDYGIMLIWNFLWPTYPINMVLAAVIVGVILLLMAL